ncbi:MAG: TorF family putative porin [Opitutaceae bacterium]|jgi:uncharacterized protein (TIGR02001 family)|nr:TorF family putative porin [Opitutaceae bacterium]
MIKQTSLALAALTAGLTAQAQDAAPAAEGSALSVTVDVTYVSDYVFRGAKLGGASIQPSVEAAYGDFYAGAWHTSELSNTTANATETDLYAGYGLALTDTLSLDAGVTRYTYEGGSNDDTTEVYVGLSADVLLSPSLYYYYDFDLETYTVEASVGYSLPIDAVNTSLDLSGAVGHVGAPGEDRTYFVVGAAVPYALSETATLTVGVDYILNDSDRLIDGDEDGVVGYAGVSIGF